MVHKVFHCSVQASLWSWRPGSCCDHSGLDALVARGILVPGPGNKPVSSAMEGRFLTAGPPGSPTLHFLSALGPANYTHVPA